MVWRPLASARSPRGRRSKLHLDESVPRSVERLLDHHGYRFSTSRRRRLTGHSDADHAALCWRERRTLVTFDFDFFEPRKVPRHRTPATVILDCDRQREQKVASAVNAMATYERLVGAVQQRTRLIVRSDGEVSVWRSAQPYEPPDERYRFRPNRPPLMWRKSS